MECERARLQALPEVGLESGSIPNPNDLLEDDIFDDGVVCLPVLEEETRNVFIELLSDHEVQVSSDPIPHKIDHVVTFQGHSIYKSTLVSQMNGNPYVYKDRLTRMKILFILIIQMITMLLRHPLHPCCREEVYEPMIWVPALS